VGSSKRQLSPEQQRILELEKEVKQLREANDILKKAHVYFLTDHAKKSTR
jgi:transposase-like protein